MYSESTSFNSNAPKISVVIRKRPLNQKELQQSGTDIIEVRGAQTLIVKEMKTKVDLTQFIEQHTFNFDFGFDENSTNEQIYMKCVRPLVQAAFQRAQVTCFAYGQTGSGKTYTMLGDIATRVPGLYLLASNDIFSALERPEFSHLTIWISFYEIYCGQLFDLLNDRSLLHVREDAQQNINIVGLQEQRINSINSLMQIIEYGSSVRVTSVNSANNDSSRSHAILQIALKEGNNVYGQISFIDLAGSERGADVIDQNKQTRMDGAQINKSLLALKECIRALDQNKNYTPFRGSKLTLVLQDSFTGNCKTVMIGAVSPCDACSEHTLNTLRYADRVQELKKPSNGELNEQLSDLDKLAKELMLPRQSKNITRTNVNTEVNNGGGGGGNMNNNNNLFGNNVFGSGNNNMYSGPPQMNDYFNNKNAPPNQMNTVNNNYVSNGPTNNTGNQNNLFMGGGGGYTNNSNAGPTNSMFNNPITTSLLNKKPQFNAPNQVGNLFGHTKDMDFDSDDLTDMDQRPKEAAPVQHPSSQPNINNSKNNKSPIKSNAFNNNNNYNQVGSNNFSIQPPHQSSSNPNNQMLFSSSQSPQNLNLNYRNSTPSNVNPNQYGGGNGMNILSTNNSTNNSNPSFVQQMQPPGQSNPSLNNPISISIEQMKNWQAKSEDDLQVISKKHEQLIGQILAEEEEVITSHRSHIDQMVELVKQEMNCLHEVDQPGSDVDQYIENIDAILAHQSELISQLREKLWIFREHLKEQNMLTKKFYDQRAQILDVFDLNSPNAEVQLLDDFNELDDVQQQWTENQRHGSNMNNNINYQNLEIPNQQQQKY